MSGRVHASEIGAAFSAAVAAEGRDWLDELLIAAGYQRRCPDGAAPATDAACGECGDTDDQP